MRSHWRVENRLHWVLNMAFQEDESRIHTGHAAHHMSLLRRLALQPAAPGGDATLGDGLPAQQARWNDGYLLKALSNQSAIALPHIGSWQEANHLHGILI